MSSTLPAGEHESEAKIPSTPIVKLADFLKEESVIDGSPLELDSNPPKELALATLGFIKVYITTATHTARKVTRARAPWARAHHGLNEIYSIIY